MKPVELNDAEIAKLFDGTNFGASGETKNGRRGLMVECILKNVAGYSDGSTIIGICTRAKLLDARSKPTRAGARWAFSQIYDSGTTIVERLARLSDLGTKS